ncbi:tetratricopeptide repeat protein [Eionea flava]
MKDKNIKKCNRLLLGGVVVLLTACASSPNEVVIRDAAGTIPSPTSSPKERVLSSSSHAENKSTRNAEKATPENSVSIVRSVNEQSVSPLQKKLRLSAQKHLAAGESEEAIRLAEKGLRIDRKDTQFYVVLARAYQQLNDTNQSAYFAQQGLRYAKKGSEDYKVLNQLAF